MHITIITIAVALAIIFATAGGLKAGWHQAIATDARCAGRQVRLWPIVGALEVIGALGLLAGLSLPVLGIVAAVGLAVLMIGAISARRRIGDFRHAGPAAVLLVVSLALIVTQFVEL